MVRIIHKTEIVPFYTFNSWNKELKKGYMTKIKNSNSFWVVVLRFRNLFLVRSY